MSSDRRNFLQRLTLGAVATAALPGALHAAPSPESFGEPAAGPAFGDELLDALSPSALAEPWDTSWTAKLTGKHRAVFDAPEIDGGVGVFRSGLWQRQVAEVFKTAPADVNSVIVLRHAAIVLAMAQPFWDEYDIGKKRKVLDPMTDKKTKKNPATLSEKDGVPPSFASMALDKQMASGTIVLACGMAFGQMVSMVAERHKIKPAEARPRTLAALVPGVILQPSGFFATTVAQQNGCIYVRAS